MVYNLLDSRNPESDYYGSEIISPESDEPYTEKDIKHFKNFCTCDHSEEARNGYAKVTPYPFHQIVNILAYEGKEFEYYLPESFSDIKAYLSTEMLLGLKDAGYNYVVITSPQHAENLKSLCTFFSMLMDETGLGAEAVFNSVADYTTIFCQEKDEDRDSRTPLAIIFSKEQLFDEEHQPLLQPIARKILQFKEFDELKQERIEEESEKERARDEAIRSALMRAGASPEQVAKMPKMKMFGKRR